jgi:hypothetical protein
VTRACGSGSPGCPRSWPISYAVALRVGSRSSRAGSARGRRRSPTGPAWCSRSVPGWPWRATSGTRRRGCRLDELSACTPSRPAPCRADGAICRAPRAGPRPERTRRGHPAAPNQARPHAAHPFRPLTMARCVGRGVRAGLRAADPADGSIRPGSALFRELPHRGRGVTVPTPTAAVTSPRAQRVAGNRSPHGGPAPRLPACQLRRPAGRRPGRAGPRGWRRQTRRSGGCSPGRAGVGLADPAPACRLAPV